MNRISSNEENLLRYGIDSDLASRAANNGLTLTKIKSLSISDIVSRFGMNEAEAKELKKCVIRQPIDIQVLGQLLNSSNFVCCVCKGTKSHAYLVHHIDPYEQTQDNSYNNLIVLCPSDHDLAHRSGGLTLSISKEQLIAEKLKWEAEVQSRNKKIASRDINLNITPSKTTVESADETTLRHLMNFINFTQLSSNIYNLPGSFDINFLDVADMMNALMVDRPHGYPFSDSDLQKTYGKYLEKYETLYQLLVGGTDGIPHYRSADQIGGRNIARRDKTNFSYSKNVEIDQSIEEARGEFEHSYRNLIAFLRKKYPKIKLDAYNKY